MRFTGLPSNLSGCLGEVGCLARRTGEFQDVEAGVRAISRVDVASAIHLDVIGLYGRLAVLVGALSHAALVGLVGDGRNVKPDLFRPVRIAYVERAHTRVEVRYKHHVVVIYGTEALVSRMRTEAAAGGAEVAAVLRDRPGRHAHGF